MEVAVKELGDIIGISSRRVQQLVSEGVFVKAKRGIYPVAENVQAYIDYMIRSKQEELNSIDHEELRLKRAQADLAEHRLEVTTGRYVEAELVHERYRNATLNMREKLLRLPRRLSLLHLPDDPRSREIMLRQELHAALKELAGKELQNEDDVSERSAS